MSDDLENMAPEAAALDASLGQPGQDQMALPEAQAAPVVSTTDEIRGVLDLVVSLVSPLFPWVATIYDEAALAKLAPALGAVFDKYGWTVSELLTRFGPEMNLAIVAWPLGIKTMMVIKAERAARAKPAASPPAAAVRPPVVDEEAIRQAEQLAADRAILG